MSYIINGVKSSWTKSLMAIILNSAIISKKAVKEFDEIALNEDVIKPKVGIVGENSC